jgi:hypothetical protein
VEFELPRVSTIDGKLDVKLGATLLAGALAGIHNKQCKVAKTRKKRKVAMCGGRDRTRKLAIYILI